MIQIVGKLICKILVFSYLLKKLFLLLENKMEKNLTCYHCIVSIVFLFPLPHVNSVGFDLGLHQLNPLQRYLNCRQATIWVDLFDQLHSPSHLTRNSWSLCSILGELGIGSNTLGVLYVCGFQHLEGLLSFQFTDRALNVSDFSDGAGSL